MPPFDPSKRDKLEDFEQREIELLGKARRVYVAGQGPAVIVMSEMPGISPYVARFARWVRDAGLTVYMPSLFGRDGVVPGGLAPWFRFRAPASPGNSAPLRQTNPARERSGSGPWRRWRARIVAATGCRHQHVLYRQVYLEHDEIGGCTGPVAAIIAHA